MLAKTEFFQMLASIMIVGVAVAFISAAANMDPSGRSNRWANQPMLGEAQAPLLLANNP